MRVLEIWRHPVKSLQGERVQAGALHADGLDGDRAWGITDRTTGRVLTGRREPRLLHAAARLGDDAQPEVTLPDGTLLRGTGPAVDAALSAWLGRAVALTAAAGAPPSEAEYFTDPTDDASAPQAWTMPAGRFVDALPLLLLTTAALRAGASAHPSGVWDVRRFRPNLLVDVDGVGWPEDDWCGREVRVGDDAVLVPHLPCERCTMVTRPQPGLERDLDVYRSLARDHGTTFGVWTRVASTGTVRPGDAVEVGPARA